MKPSTFEYHRPSNLNETLEMLSSLEDAKVLAGGQSLGPMLNFRYVMPENVIDINRVSELQGIRLENNRAIKIGAMTRQYQIEKDAHLHQQLPIFREALRWVGHYATRNRGTLGGSLAHLDPAAELPGLCALLDAELVIKAQGSERIVSIHDWAVSFMQPNIEENELLSEIIIHPWDVSHGFSFLEMSRRHGDFAIAGVACLLSLDDKDQISKAAVSLIGVANGAVRLRNTESLLLGQSFSMDLAESGAAVIDGLEAPADAHHSGSFRKKTAKTLFKRALKQAYDNAKERRVR
jgi:carbon-monoxide dehydrogenase medium subunit